MHDSVIYGPTYPYRCCCDSTETDASASGESSGGSGNASFISSASGSASGSGSSYYSGGSASGQHEVSAFLQVSDQDGGIQCSDAGQYECVAGVDTRTESISINVTVTGGVHLMSC